MCWGGRFFLKGDRRLDLFCFTKLLTVLHKCPSRASLSRRIRGTRRKHNMKFRQIGHTTSQYGQSFFPKTISAWNGLAFAEAPSLAVFRSNLHASLPHNTLEGSCGIQNQKLHTLIIEKRQHHLVLQQRWKKVPE